MHDQQGFDAIEMASALSHQTLPFPMQSSRVLILRRRHADNTAALRIALHPTHDSLSKRLASILSV